MKKQVRNRWGKSDPATVNLLVVNVLTWRIKALQKLILNTCPRVSVRG